MFSANPPTYLEAGGLHRLDVRRQVLPDLLRAVPRDQRHPPRLVQRVEHPEPPHAQVGRA